MNSKLKINDLQIEAKNTVEIRDLSTQETAQIFGGAGEGFEGLQVANELLTGSKFSFQASGRITQRAILEITGF